MISSIYVIEALLLLSGALNSGGGARSMEEAEFEALVPNFPAMASSLYR